MSLFLRPEKDSLIRTGFKTESVLLYQRQGMTHVFLSHYFSNNKNLSVMRVNVPYASQTHDVCFNILRVVIISG